MPTPEEAIRARIVEVMAKYNRTLLIEVRSSSLLRPASKPPELPTDPVERAQVTRKNADYYRRELKPFA